VVVVSAKGVNVSAEAVLPALIVATKVALEIVLVTVNVKTGYANAFLGGKVFHAIG